MNAPPITADSIPDLDEWGWDDFWGCDEWVIWHKALVDRYGLEQANRIFATFWNKQTFGAHALGCRTVDSDFRDYVKSVGLWETVWESAEGLKYILQPAGSVLQTGGTVGTAIGKGLETTAQLSKFIVPLALVGIAIYAYRKFG